MSRREEVTRSPGKPDDRVATCCASSAGESPVPVSVGAPGSRPQSAGEIPKATAGHRKPVTRREPNSGERERGPQHELKPAASTQKQWGSASDAESFASRAAHVTAKATSSAPVPKRAAGPSGVWGAARVQGDERNTRGPSALPSSRQGCSYKPKAKSSTTQRESEGIVVPLMAAKNNATGGKGPWGGHAREAG